MRDLSWANNAIRVCIGLDSENFEINDHGIRLKLRIDFLIVQKMHLAFTNLNAPNLQDTTIYPGVANDATVRLEVTLKKSKK